MTVFNKEFLSWYLITLKLKQTVDAGLPPIQGCQQRPWLPPESAWMITVREKLEIAKKDNVAGTWGKLCIYKVPQYLRDGEDKAYIPNMVSIGPYHHGKEHLQGMEHHKWRAFDQILRRGEQDAKLYLDSIKKLEARARECYEGQITISSKDFVQMMVLDGCFLLELVLGFHDGFKSLGYSRYDPVFTERGSFTKIIGDMIMLENQIPMFVLDRLYGLLPGKPELKGFVAYLVKYSFSWLMPFGDPWLVSLRFDPMCVQSHHHCLDVIRQSLLRRGPDMELRRKKRWLHSSRVARITRGIRWRIKEWLHSSRVAWRIKIWLRRITWGIRWRIEEWLHSSSRVTDGVMVADCVTKLKEAGIKFKRRKTNRFWDIKFKNGVLKIPGLYIGDGTKTLFLNLFAFEKSHLYCSGEISLYLTFMDCLIHSQEDVGYLRYCGILEHDLGTDADVAVLFNRFNQYVSFDNNNNNNRAYISKLIKVIKVANKVNRFYSHRWNAWRASLIHDYFSNPWTIISIVAAVILLILTAAQTFYGVYGFYSPPS